MYRHAFRRKVPRWKEAEPSPWQIARNLYIVVAFIASQGLGATYWKAVPAYGLIGTEVGYELQLYWILLLGATIFEALVDRYMERTISEKLIDITPTMARVRREGEEVEVPVEEVLVGDVVLIRPGERIPVDGVVTVGSSAVDQAPITGESIPVEKVVGDEVFAGTVNGRGMLQVKTTKMSEETTLSRIIDLVDEAQKAKPRVEKFLDSVAIFSIPMVLAAMGVVTYFQGLGVAIVVLFIAAPTAMLLATPMAVLATMSRASRLGILIKGGSQIEANAGLNAMAADKTGTLTQGRCQVTDTIDLEDSSDGGALALASIAEKFSEHPLAGAIMTKAKESGLDVPDPDNFEGLPGLGVVAEQDGKRIIVGRRKLLEDRGVEVTEEVESLVGSLESQGKTITLVSNDGRLTGVIAIADIVRQDALEAVEHLNESGIRRFVMLTGDNARTARAIAGELGIAEFYAEMLPQQKLEKIKEIRVEGSKIGMIGDGINDAPALAVADVGIAMGVAGTDVAIESSDIALMTDDLTRVCDAIHMSRRARRTIRWNVIFALLFNIVGIGVASLGLLTPEIAIIANTLSSIVVIASSARLLR
ncbi:MAG: heavy metal translocating P-type ATPase [Candidatus Bathyarchaeia archaeon]